MSIRVVCWFSCGDASAVATKLALAKYLDDEVAVARCVVPEEHPDNDRFAADCAAWFGVEVNDLRSVDYASCDEVWRKRRYMSGILGAICSVEMKKVVRHAFERSWHPDVQVFGFTAEEADRAERFRSQNPEVRLECPLIDEGLTKEDCHAIVRRAGLEVPMMYRLGFPNANCRGCVNAQSPTYWNHVRRVFPDVFDQRARLSRELDVRLVKGTTGERERLFLDELDPEMGRAEVMPPMECSLLCYMAEQKL
jgi:hypothetical protein